MKRGCRIEFLGWHLPAVACPDDAFLCRRQRAYALKRMMRISYHLSYSK